MPGTLRVPRAHAALVAAAVHLGSNFYPWVLATHVQRTDAFRAVHFVGREGHQVDAVGLYVNRNLANCLGAIGHEQGAVLVGNGGNFADGLDQCRSRCCRT